MAAFCTYYKELLKRRELQLRRHRTDDTDSIARTVAQEAYPSLSESWSALSDRAGAAALEALTDRSLHTRVRYATEMLVTSAILGSPVIRRSFEKPLGYPGDFRIMEYYFENDFRGDSAFDKIFHKMSVEHPLARGVPTRSEWVVEEIDKFLQTSKDSPYPARVLNLGAGAGFEIDRLHARSTYPRSVSWTLIDQDDGALTTAFKRTRHLANASPRPFEVDCVHVGFAQLKSTSLADSIGEQELIFSTGLFDYLKEPMAQLLLRQLYDMLHDNGGVLIVANASWPNTHYWGPEFTLRWPLIYRTKDDMKALAAMLPKEAKLSITDEPSNAYWLMRCEKPPA